MKSDRTFSETLKEIWYVVACVFWATFLALSVAVLYKTFVMDVLTPGRKWLHFYFAVGFAAFFPLILIPIPRVRHNLKWLATFTHELTHTVFALLFFRKMSAFVVDGKDDRASFSGGWLGYKTITLSPYCVPVITLALLPWRFTTGDPVFLSVIDFLIGLTYAFHVCCWMKQVRTYQSDIQGPGIIRSLLIIASFQIIGLCIVILTTSSGVVLALQRVCWIFPKEVILSILG